MPYVPTPSRGIKKMVEVSAILDSAKQDTEVNAIDLGAGTGKMLFHIAKNTPCNVHLYGIEHSRVLYFFSKLRLYFSPRKNRITLLYGDWSSVFLGEFDYVFLFLTSTGFRALLPKFKAELKGGSVIVSYLFKLSRDSEIQDIFDEREIRWKKKHKIFVYKKKTSLL